MTKILKHIANMDWVMVFITLALTVFGLISIHGGTQEGTFYRQTVFLVIGLVIMTVFSFFDWRNFKENPYLLLALYFTGIAMLLGLFVFAPSVKGVRRWYDFGIVSFDPVEYMKVVLIILLAKYFSDRHVEMYRFSHIIFSGIYVAIPSLITFFQPDLGSALILVSLWLGVLLLSGIKTKHLIVLIIIGAILFSLSWSFVLKDYQKARLTGFLKPRIDPQGINWNPDQAKIAIGSGGLFGYGIGEGPQTRLGFLPETETDFIFSAIAEETGFVGVTVLLSLFILLIWRILKIALIAPDNFSRLYCSGFAIILLVQTFVNIAMNQGLLPIVGIPLPLVSHGGSSLVFAFLSLGIVQSIRLSGKS